MPLGASDFSALAAARSGINMRATWTSGKAINANIDVQLAGAFWVFCIVVFVGFLIWWWGWGPKIKEAAKTAFEKEFVDLYK